MQTTPQIEHRVTARDDASFRDPAGFVFYHDGRVLRALTERGRAAWQAARESGAARELIEQGLMVEAREVEAEAGFPEAALYLEHERIDPVIPPAEWTASMLADAGLLTLDVQAKLLDHGLSLQDATAFNVAFRDGRPVFLDVTSIVKPARLDVWYALGQFQRMFLYPLYLARRGLTPAEVFLTSLDGLPPERTARMLGRLGWLRPGLLFSVYLPAWLGGKGGGATDKPGGKTGGNPDVQKMILNAQRRRLRRLRAKFRPRGTWVDYRQEHSYSDEDEQAKRQAVEVFGASLKGRRVLDLGANTGAYSRILTGQGCRVLAAEGDHDAADQLYRELRAEDARGIDVLRVNLANPTPGAGFMNRERKGFLARGRSDGAVALALVHHLIVSAGLTVAMVAELLDTLAPRLLVEYVAPDDPMFRRLVSGREDLWGDLTEESFTAAFTERGLKPARRTELKRKTRVLLEFAAKA